MWDVSSWQGNACWSRWKKHSRLRVYVSWWCQSHTVSIGLNPSYVAGVRRWTGARFLVCSIAQRTLHKNLFSQGWISWEMGDVNRMTRVSISNPSETQSPVRAAHRKSQQVQVMSFRQTMLNPTKVSLSRHLISIVCSDCSWIKPWRSDSSWSGFHRFQGHFGNPLWQFRALLSSTVDSSWLLSSDWREQSEEALVGIPLNLSLGCLSCKRRGMRTEMLLTERVTSKEIQIS